MQEERGLFGSLYNGLKDGYDRYRGRKRENQNPAISAPVPRTRQSIPSHRNKEGLLSQNGGEDIILPDFIFEVIPVMRKLTMMNPDVSQAFKNMVYLVNTGHRIHFNSEIPIEKREKMKKHIDDISENWGSGVAGVDGISAKMIAQVAISGALSVETIPNRKLTGLDNVVMVPPEYIRFEYRSGRYWPMQKVPETNFFDKKRRDPSTTHVKLNPNTFIYYGILSDQDMPYGVPPYLSAMNSLETQNFMMDNIKFVVEQVGLMGFLEVLVEKPEQDVANGEDDTKYKARLEAYLEEAVTRMKESMRNGISVGYKDSTEFEFHSPSKNANGIADIFDLNELQILSALNMDGALMGRDYTSGFEAIGVIFMKMLSEFVTIQNMVSKAWERIYTQELILAGYTDFGKIRVESKRSTLMDELKMQQGKQLTIANANALYNMGIINQNQVAEMTGYDKPDQPEPRIPIDLSGAMQKKQDEQKKEGERKKKKNRKDSSKDPSPDNKTRKNN